MKYTPINDPELLKQKLTSLPDWTVNQSGKLEREYTFKDFSEAFAFLSRIALLSEKMNHHAEIYNVYHKVKLKLITHDSAGLTDLDFRFAEEAEKFASTS